MSIESLIRDVEALAATHSQRIVIRSDAGLNTSLSQPAAVTEEDWGFLIDIFAGASPFVRREALAHELGHLLVMYRGLIRPHQRWNFNDYLTLELNNALSHRHLITTLTGEYDLSSGEHLRLRRGSLESAEENIGALRDCVEGLHGIGLALLDISLTIPDLADLADARARSDESVHQALLTGRSRLEMIAPAQEPETQWGGVRGFYADLGYSV